VRTSTTLTISADHPSFAGHFPGTPILPGVLLLDETLHVLHADESLAHTHWRIGRAKFLKPVRPGETLLVEHERLPSGAVHFLVSSAGSAVAEGMLLPDTGAEDGQQTG
jgi:3-hydroxymyristoyl/3-hydroxydecanoyl-(acyl carrier protein) dehydratase